jgi:hypothetical protein
MESLKSGNGNVYFDDEEASLSDTSSRSLP